VVRRLAAPGGREPVNWSENLPMHLHYRCLPRDPDQSRGTRPEATRDPGNREEVQWSNRTCDAAGGSRACWRRAGTTACTDLDRAGGQSVLPPL